MPIRTLAAMTDAVTAASQAADAAGVVAPPTQTLMVLRAGSRWLALPAQAVRGWCSRASPPASRMLRRMCWGGAVARRLLPVVSLEVLLPAGREAAPLPATLPRLVVIETDQGSRHRCRGSAALSTSSKTACATRQRRPADRAGYWLS